ncbi:hypothetical protein CH373_00135 [Leptospira perolatii]|uniref:FecR protein domain-containing protein n=1 Tax=Leptospira perolatii TaxID=2023191 RepID=A0A2M9ZR14_9LEPT|nr:FecR family protein [Leptospira perolatii]PJZ70984.1 hypothetical protein CH360_00135 [Leptospira perolatii]PJZ74516.1 hypothetical protein CH373_00135 [Leptospira perolatii]
MKRMIQLQFVKRKYAAFAVFTLVAFCISSCSFFSILFSKYDSNQSVGMVVIFHAGPVQILRSGKKLQIQTGTVLKENDEISTQSGTMDLQSVEGHILRIKSFTKLSLNKIAHQQNSETSLALKIGSVLVKANKLDSKESFKVSGPTAIAAVRGTSFSFDVVEGELPKIKVYEGLVAMTLKFPSDKEISSESIAQKPLYQKFTKLLENYEVVISENESAEVKPEFDELVQLILTRLESKNLKEDEVHLSEEALGNSFAKASFKPAPQEKAELETIVQLEQKHIDQALELDQKALKSEEASAAQGEATELTKKLEADYNDRIDQSLTRIEEDAKSQKLDSEEDIREFYNVLEIIHKSDNTLISGAIVTQVGDTLIVHSPKGVFRLDKNLVDFVDYKNFNIVTKKKQKSEK